MNELLARAKAFGRRKYPELADDFSQFVAVKCLDGTAPGWSLSQAWVDFLRSYFYGKKKDRPVFVELNAGYFKSENKDWDSPESYLTGLKRDQRAAFILRYKWEFTLAEIGQCLDMAPEWVSTILAEAYVILKITGERGRIKAKKSQFYVPQRKRGKYKERK